MKRLLDRIYARQREISWRVLACRVEGIGWIVLYVLLLILALLR